METLIAPRHAQRPSDEVVTNLYGKTTFPNDSSTRSSDTLTLDEREYSGPRNPGLLPRIGNIWRLEVLVYADTRATLTPPGTHTLQRRARYRKEIGLDMRDMRPRAHPCNA